MTVPISEPRTPDWRNTLLRDELGDIKPMEINAWTILKNDPSIRETVNQFRGRDLDAVSLDAMLFLQREHNIRIGFMMVRIMVKVLNDQHAKVARQIVREQG